jgi:hypothetical protein
METLNTYNKDDIKENIPSLSIDKDFDLKNHENLLTYFNENINLIMNNPSLTLRILQDIKRRDEIRELYNTHINSNKRKRNFNSPELLNNEDVISTDNNSNEITKITKEVKVSGEDDKDEKINKVVNKNKISKKNPSEVPKEKHDLKIESKIKPIFPEEKKCLFSLPKFIEINHHETFYIKKHESEGLESNIDKTFHFEPIIVYDERWDEIPDQQLLNNWTPPLIFDSRFESGNLHKAIRMDEYDYFLQLRTDYNTNGHVQWFFFQVKNMIANHEYRFTIGNFTKQESLFNNGMKLLLYSKKKEQNEKIGWYRTGFNIRYTKDKRNSNFKNTCLLDVSIIFPESDDTCYIAYCYPYTYTDLQR